MSIRVMSAVWASNRYASGSLLILLAMADYANDDDNTCRPAIPSLAAKARLSERQVHRILRQFEADGVIAAVGEYPSRRGKPITIYQINVAALTKSDAGKGDILSDKDDILSSYGADNMTSATPKHDICDAENMTPMSYDPSLDPPIEPSGSARARAAAVPPAPPTAQPSADFGEQPNTTRSLVALPAVVAYRDVFLAYPSRAQMVQIQAHGIEDLHRWSSVCAAWCQAGYSPRNIGGLLDWYDDPQRAAANGNRQRAAAEKSTPRTRVDASMQAVDNVMAMIERGEM